MSNHNEIDKMDSKVIKNLSMKRIEKLTINGKPVRITIDPNSKTSLVQSGKEKYIFRFD